MTKRRNVPSLGLGIFLFVLAVVFWQLRAHSPGTRRTAPYSLVAIVERGLDGAVYAVGLPGGPVRVGRFPGFAAPFDMAAACRGALFVALGSGVARVVPGDRVTMLRPARGRSLQVFSERGRLYLIAEVGEEAPVLYRLRHGRFARLGAAPPGFVRFLTGRRHPWLLIIRPERTLVWWPGSRALSTALPAPESGSLDAGVLVMPDARAPRRVLLLGARGGATTLRSPYGPVLAVTGPPTWVVTTGGMWQIRDGKSGAFRPWPSPPPAGLGVLGAGPWVLVREEALGGVWFNLDTGRFGQTSQLQWTGADPVLDLVVWPK